MDMWIAAIAFGIISLILCSVLWLTRKDPAGKPDSSDTAMGLGMLDTHHSHGPVDSGGTGAGSAAGDGGSSPS